MTRFENEKPEEKIGQKDEDKGVIIGVKEVGMFVITREEEDEIREEDITGENDEEESDGGADNARVSSFDGRLKTWRPNG